MPVVRHGVRLANHNETLLPVVRRGTYLNHNETLVPAVRPAISHNHNGTVVVASGIHLELQRDPRLVRVGA